jgi:ATP-dependent DNA helicase RecG
LPHYKTDALVRRQNLDCYDDRLYVQTNLIDTYEQLMGFIAKHLPAKLLIYADKVVTENATTPHTYGHLTPDNFTPFPKNPVIAKFFTQLGHVDELGSGILNVNKYLPHYTLGQLPVFDEGDIFRMTIPLEVSPAGGVKEGKDSDVGGVFGGVNQPTKERWVTILKLI